jgi:hypothetical protein
MGHYGHMKTDNFLENMNIIGCHPWHGLVKIPYRENYIQDRGFLHIEFDAGVMNRQPAYQSYTSTGHFDTFSRASIHVNVLVILL